MLEAFRKKFRKADGLFRDAENTEHTALHSVVMPLYYGMVEERDLPAVIDCIRSKGICCGVYMAYFLLKGLARCGEYDLMNELLFSEGEHSWANMLREGATTCWEAWGKEQKWNTSLCHPWASAPVVLFFEDVAGVRPAKPGFETIEHTPHAPEWLGDMELCIGTVKGPLRVRRTSGEWSLEWMK